MNADREDPEIRDHVREKKKFIREQLKPQWRKRVLSILHRLLLVLCAAVLFGGISAISFYVMRVYFPWQEQAEGAASLPVSTAKDQAVRERSISDEIDEDMLASLEYYEKMSEQLAEVGKSANAAVVGIRKSDWSFSGVITDQDPLKRYCGILFHETAKQYYILTEYAVAQERDPLVAEVAQGESGNIVEAKVAGSCERLGLAVVCIDKSRFTKAEQEKIVIAELADSSAPALGTPVLAVGKPNGNLYSVCTGVITQEAVQMSILDQGLQLYMMNLPYQAGRSGFVLNIRGQLLGMLTMEYPDVTGEVDTAFFGLSNLVTDMNQMMQGKQMPCLGIHGLDMNDETADALGIASGIYVAKVASDSPAYRGEIRVADVISEIDGHDVQTMDELHQYLAGCQPGQEVSIKFYREKESKKKKITLQ